MNRKDVLVALGIAIAAIVAFKAGESNNKPPVKPPSISLEATRDSLVIRTSLPPNEAARVILDSLLQASGNILNQAIVANMQLAQQNAQLKSLVAEQQLKLTPPTTKKE